MFTITICFLFITLTSALNSNACPGLADVIFLMDSSGSKGKLNYGKQLQFAVNLTRNFKLGKDGARVGHVIFGDNVVKQFDMKIFDCQSSLENALLATPYLASITRTHLGLQFIQDNTMFGAENGGRDKAKKMIIVITDGQSSRPDLTLAAAKHLREQGVTILAIGVGNFNSTELKNMAGRSDLVFSATSFDTLGLIEAQVIQGTCASTDTVQCGLSKSTRTGRSLERRLSPRIVGGGEVGSCDVFPWMVNLNVDGGQLSGAVILDETHILTSAYCAINRNTIVATVGEYDISSLEGTEQVFNIDVQKGVLVHPEFDYNARKHDMAVLTLTRPINFTRPCAMSMCLDQNYKFDFGQKCVHLGWGMTDENNFLTSDILMSVEISTYQGTDCKAAFPGLAADYLSYAEKQICSGEKEGGRDGCGGDNGGPLFCLNKGTGRWVMVGLASYGEGCARPEFPMVSVDVRQYYDWIQQAIKPMNKV